MSDRLLQEVHGSVLLLTIHYEETLNCFDVPLLEEMADALRAFNKSKDLRALVITGSGRAFCTGADLKAFTELSAEDNLDWCMGYEETIFHQLSSSLKPTIAAVNGFALGGGMELALACDFRIGVPKCRFSSPEYNFGWIPGWGGAYRLGKLVGAAKAKEILLLKKTLFGKEALEAGLLTELVEDPAQLVPRALEMGEQLAALNPLTVAYTKVSLDDFNVPRYDSMLQSMTNGIASKTAYAERQVEAFFNRKK